MIKVWQAKNNPPHDVLSGPLGHIGGLPCRRHAQHSMRLARAQVISWKSAKAIMRKSVLRAKAGQGMLTGRVVVRTGVVMRASHRVSNSGRPGAPGYQSNSGRPGAPGNNQNATTSTSLFSPGRRLRIVLTHSPTSRRSTPAPRMQSRAMGSST